MGENVPHDLDASGPPFPTQPAHVLSGVKLRVQRELFKYPLRVMKDFEFVVLDGCYADVGVTGRPLVPPLSRPTPDYHKLIVDAQLVKHASGLPDAGLNVGVDVVLDWGSHGANYNRMHQFNTT